MSGEVLLQARSLSLEKGGRRLCTDLDLGIEAGSCWGILGPNGAGKSTLLHVLAGLEPAEESEVFYRAHSMHSWKRRELARELGVLFQLEESGLSSTLFETVLSGRHPHLGSFGLETAEDLAIAQEAIEANFRSSESVVKLFSVSVLPPLSPFAPKQRMCQSSG